MINIKYEFLKLVFSWLTYFILDDLLSRWKTPTNKKLLFLVCLGIVLLLMIHHVVNTDVKLDDNIVRNAHS